MGMKIGIDMGHTLSGAGTGAVGFKVETEMNRLVGKSLISKLKKKGHYVVDCTVDKSASDLKARVNKANGQSLDLYVSIHLNAYEETTSEMGVETYSLASTGKGYEYAKKIQNELVKSIGWKNRGVKQANFYVLKYTKAPAVLVELGFCDSKGDMAKWDTDKIANSLFKSITGNTYEEPKPPTNTVKYRVVTGTYADKANAIAQQEKLKKAGFDSFLVAINS